MPTRPTRTEMRAEMRRRLDVLERRAGSTIIIAPYEIVRGTIEFYRAPAGHKLIASANGSWAQIAESGGGAVFHMPKRQMTRALSTALRGVGATTPAVDYGELTDPPKDAEELRRLLRKPDLDLGDFNELVPAQASVAEGHFSEAHSRLLHHETFTTGWDPLSGGPFTLIQNDDLRSDSGKVEYDGTAGASRVSMYTWDTAGTPPNDCSVEYVAAAIQYGNTPGVVGRHTGSTSFYQGRLSDQALQLYSFDGTNSLIGSYATTVSAGVVRLEMVGTAIKVYLNSVERISATDADHSTGETGIRYSHAAGASTGTLDDLKVYDEGGRARPLVGGTLADGKTGLIG